MSSRLQVLKTWIAPRFLSLAAGLRLYKNGDQENWLLSQLVQTLRPPLKIFSSNAAHMHFDPGNARAINGACDKSVPDLRNHEVSASSHMSRDVTHALYIGC